ncbi:hypothetical protein BDR07DRAFT_1460543 [Suillus spraguei]|nr:hypothetical protein BDR07DRAFT_1460543 [Suillus spraguei]
MYDSLGTDNEKFHIDLGVLDGDGGAHPEAAGKTLFLSGLPKGEYSIHAIENWKLEGFGRHIAFQRSLLLVFHLGSRHRLGEEILFLQVWDWQHSATSNCVLVDTTINTTAGIGESFDFCFLGNDRLLIVNEDLKLYSIEDLSQPPRLLACFLMPVPVTGILLPTDDIAHSSRLQMQAQRTMIFFNPQVGVLDGMAEIPWEYWGPLNVRVFVHNQRCRVGVSGNRVLQAFPATDATAEHHTDDMGYRLHMMDFSSLTVERRQGLGRVVTEPSTIIIESTETLTSLPYVEVVSDRIFGADQVMDIWVNKDRIYLPKLGLNIDGIDELEVIEISSGVSICNANQVATRRWVEN